ncbi:MAG: VOC family protein [Chitinophagaceae bacterium]
MKKITPCIWFDNQGEDAMNYYISIFKNSKILSETRNGDAGPGPKGSLLAASFDLDGTEIYLLNGGPHYTLSPAFSLFVKCVDQEEVDYYWDKLGTGGIFMQCGWLTDKYGVSWQVVPNILQELLQDKDPKKSGRVMQAMMKMIKLDIQQLKDAASAS